MKKHRIYVDTSVIGGCLDTEFKEWSDGLLLDFKAGIFVPVLSLVTDAEIADAPLPVRNIYSEFMAYAEPLLYPGDEALALANIYIDRGILPRKFHEDALHIAMASVAAVDLLVSWNFKHIVHFDKINRFNAINMECGYKPIAIYSPREVTCYGIKDN